MIAIIFNNYMNDINGAVTDLVEYYLCILEQNKNIRLLILNYNPTFEKILINLIRDRYELNNLNFKKNIIGITKSDLLRMKFYRVLIVDYGTIVKVKGLINIKDINSKIIIMSDLHTEKSSHIIDKKLYPEGCVTYYGEMPFVYKDIQYHHKLLFSRLKPLTKVEPNIFLHSPKNDNFDFIPTLHLPRDKKIIFKTGQHKQHLFELFDTFIYYHANKWFDPRPRLMLECYFYGKKILYYNELKIKDGSYYLYNDMIQNGIKYRYLDESDEIVRQFI